MSKTYLLEKVTLKEKLVCRKETIQVGNYSLEFINTVGAKYRNNLEYLILISSPNGNKIKSLEEIEEKGL